MGELLLRQIVQRVGLVLSGGGIFYRIPAVRQFFNPRIMPRGDIVRPKRPAPHKKRLPLYITVTDITGIGRPAAQVFLHKIIYDAALKFLCKIHGIMRNPQQIRNFFCILRRRAKAAFCRFFSLSVSCIRRGESFAFLPPHLHGNADDLIPRFLQKVCRNRRIHAARHTYYNLLPHSFAIFSSLPFLFLYSSMVFPIRPRKRSFMSFFRIYYQERCYAAHAL